MVFSPDGQSNMSEFDVKIEGHSLTDRRTSFLSGSSNLKFTVTNVEPKLDSGAERYSVPLFHLSLCPWHSGHHLLHSHEPFQSLSLHPDGWLCGSDSLPFLWIPPEYHNRLMFPYSKVLMSTGHPVSINLTNFVHGEQWIQCFQRSI
ncbi:hypothetical protein BDP27DRAFT_537737 [Rhodocollybia butyracea]|uniref:Uncharacterized protein n=1 Tax=Rhodocollybia butyracea TaxID=206335 RepID=A0A9P5TYY0_9AGAR|nr:hypothetical protein BDP27DRAFT_537737 [Rhodocollybia butyracea]